MPPLSLIFNKLQVVIPAKKLSLSVDSSVSLQCSSGNAQPMKTRQLLDLLCSGKIWVTRGIGCRIDFTFLLDKQQGEKPAMEKMIRDFAGYVRDAPLWSQVSLNAELELRERDTSDDLQSSFSIILTHPPVEGISAHSSIPPSSATPNVQVPTGVPCFQLRRIKIVMVFNFGRAYQTLRPLLPCTAANIVEDGFEKKCESASLPSCLLLYQAGLNSPQAVQSTSSLHFNTLLREDHEMLDDDTLLYDIDVTTPLLTTHSLTKSLSALPSPPNSQEEDIEDTPTDCGMASFTSDLNDAREMAHLALRKLVGGRQNKSQPGIKVVLRRPTLTLSELAPSLFSPGFAEAMSQRSQFIPAISHALSASLLRNAQSPSLRRKLLSLASNPVQPPDNDIMMDPVDGINNRSDFAGHLISRTLGRIIGERLWAMMQHSLYHPPPAPRILPAGDVDAGVHGALTVGLVKTSTSGPEEAKSVINESLSFMGYGLDFFDNDFEDLFEDMPDKRECEEFEALFSDSTNERSTDDDFEDLLEDEPPNKPDQAVDVAGEECEMGFDIIVDDGFRYWGNVQNISTGDLLDERHFEQYEIQYIEDENMLI